MTRAAAATRAGPQEPLSASRLTAAGLAASVALLVGFALIGALDAFAFGAVAALWALGVAWVVIFGPPVIDRDAVWAWCRDAWSSWRPTSISVPIPARYARWRSTAQPSRPAR